MNRTARTFRDLDAMSRAAAEMIAAEARARPACSIVLSGGATPRRLFELLGTTWRERLPWGDIHLFWSDERFVPPDDAASNYGTAADLFIDRVPIPPQNVHRVPTGLRSLSDAADAYEQDVRRYLTGAGVDGFDLAVLGVGTDGHTASLFPGHQTPPDRWVEAVSGPERHPPRERITLTYSALQASRTVLFLVAGAEKRDVLVRIAAGEDLPASRVRGTEQTVFLMDRAAAPGNDAVGL